MSTDNALGVLSGFGGPNFRRVRRIPEELESAVLASLDSFAEDAARESQWNVVRTASHSVLSMT
jgi:hypothetical protein